MIEELRKDAKFIPKRLADKVQKFMNKIDHNPAGVAVTRDGYSQWVAFLYRMKRENKPDVVYCMDLVCSRAF